MTSGREPRPIRGAKRREERGAALLRFADLMERIVDVTGRIASWLALAMVLVIAFNVLRRYVFGVSSVALQELEWHLMVPLVLFGVSYAMRHREHVRIDFLFDRYPKTLQHIVDALSGVATVIVSVIVIDFSLDYVDQSLTMGEGSPDPGGLSHRFLLKAFIPLGFGLLAVEGAAVALRHTVLAVRGERHG